MKKFPKLVLVFMVIFAVSVCERAAIQEPEAVNPSSLSKTLTVTVFTGKENHRIFLAQATQMMAAFQNANPDEPYGWYFGGEAIKDILAQKGVVGLRIYGGLNEDGDFSPVIFGVTANGMDIDGSGGSGLFKALIDSVVILEKAMPCPPC